jgi:hypothetical protein
MVKTKKKVVSKKVKPKVAKTNVHSMASEILVNFKKLGAEVSKFNKLVEKYEKKTGKALVKAKDKIKIKKTVGRCQ